MKRYLIVVLAAALIMLAAWLAIRPAVQQMQTIQEEQVALIDSILD